LAEGSVEAFDEIYARYSAIIYKEALRLLRSREMAKDLVQEIFATLWDRRSRFEEVEHFQAYLVTMSKNLAYQYLFKASKEVVAKDEVMRSVRLYDNATEDEIDFRELETLIEETVDMLPVRQREVYDLARNRGLNYEAIADRLNISPNTVKNHLIAAKQFIRKRLAHTSPFIVILLTSLG
jgi:RNA polymerase sigma-70 factor (family 1)